MGDLVEPPLTASHLQKMRGEESSWFFFGGHPFHSTHLYIVCVCAI